MNAKESAAALTETAAVISDDPTKSTGTTASEDSEVAASSSTFASGTTTTVKLDSWEEVKKARNRINSQRTRERERHMIQSLESERARLSISNDAIRFQNRTFRAAIAQMSQIMKIKETAEGGGAAHFSGKNGFVTTAEIPAISTNGPSLPINNRNDLMAKQALLQAAALSSSPASSARHTESKFNRDISSLEIQSILLRHRLQQRQQMNIEAQQMMMAAGDNGGVGAGASGISYNKTFDGIREPQQMHNLTNVMSGMNNSNNGGCVGGGNNNFHFNGLNGDNGMRLQQLLIQNRGMMSGIGMQNSNIASLRGGGRFGTVSPTNNNHGSTIEDMSNMFSHNSGSSDVGAVGGKNFVGGGVGMNGNSSNALMFGKGSGSI